MKVRFLLPLSFIFFLSLTSFQAGATALNLELNTIENLNDLVFYPNGTHTCGNVTGYLLITNPSLNHTVSSININFNNGVTPSHAHINEIKPRCTAKIPYEFESSKISLPVITETINPSFLCSGVEQEIVFEVEISNSGCKDIQILQFGKKLPEQLKLINYTLSSGTLKIKCNNFQWENFSVNSGGRECLRLIFTVIPFSELNFSSSNLSFTTPVYEASRNFSLSAVTSTKFAVEKQRLGEDEWKVGVIVEDASEFDFLLYNVKVYVSDTMLNEPKLIKDYYLNSKLRPGENWKESFIYKYSGTPVFFAKIYYTIPYVIYSNSIPLKASGNENFVINSIISGEEVHHNRYNNQKLKVITSASLLPENVSVQQAISQVDEKSNESFSFRENGSFRNSSLQTDQLNVSAEDRGKFFRLLPLILLFLGLFGLVGGKILSFLSFFWKK